MRARHTVRESLALPLRYVGQLSVFMPVMTIRNAERKRELLVDAHLKSCGS